MENNKLRAPKRIFSSLSRRRGSALPLALVVALIGSALVAMMLETSGSFVGTASRQRKPYSDAVAAESYIEQVKGKILHKNISMGKVLHSEANITIMDYVGDAPINDIGVLLITSPDIQIAEIFSGDVVRRYVKVDVYDANYNPAKIASSFSEENFENLPPSFFIRKVHEAENIGSGPDGELYEETTPTMDETKLYEKYGAYLVRVEIYNVDDDNTLIGNPIRTTEEAFIHRLQTDF